MFINQQQSQFDPNRAMINAVAGNRLAMQQQFRNPGQGQFFNTFTQRPSQNPIINALAQTPQTPVSSLRSSFASRINQIRPTAPAEAPSPIGQMVKEHSAMFSDSTAPYLSMRPRQIQTFAPRSAGYASKIGPRMRLF